MKNLPVFLFLAFLSWNQCARAQTERASLEKSLVDLDQRLRQDPSRPDIYQERGCVYFKLGKFTASVRDFDKVIELKPEYKRNHWQRGISCYYAGQYDIGRKQFESCQTYDDNDVENTVWRFMCMARADGIPKARQEMFKRGEDRRVPMRQIYEMFSGKLEPAAVLAAAQTGSPEKEKLKQQLFYAHLYVGIYYDLSGDSKSALDHLLKAADNYRIAHYMGDVARVHRDLLKKNSYNKPP